MTPLKIEIQKGIFTSKNYFLNILFKLKLILSALILRYKKQQQSMNKTLTNEHFKIIKGPSIGCNYISCNCKYKNV